MTDESKDLEVITDEDWDGHFRDRKAVIHRQQKALALFDQLESMGIKNVDAIPDLIKIAHHTVGVFVRLEDSIAELESAFDKLYGGVPDTTNG